MKNNEKGTISMSLVAEALVRARARGLDVPPLIAAAGIAPQMLASPRGRVSSAQYGALWSGIAQALDDEFFGQDSHPMRSGSFVAMTQAALTARTGRQALQRATGFMRLVLDDLAAQVEADAQRVRLTFVHRPGTPEPAMFTYATWFIMVYGLVCWLVGRRIPLIAARFRCSAPPAEQEYRLMFCDDMAFGQPESCVDLSPGFLDLPVIQTAASIKAFLRDAPGSFIVKYRNPDAPPPQAGRPHLPVDQGRSAARHRDQRAAGHAADHRRHRGGGRVCRAERVPPGLPQVDRHAADGLPHRPRGRRQGVMAGGACRMPRGRVPI